MKQLTVRELGLLPYAVQNLYSEYDKTTSYLESIEKAIDRYFSSLSYCENLVPATAEHKLSKPMEKIREEFLQAKTYKAKTIVILKSMDKATSAQITECFNYFYPDRDIKKQNAHIRDTCKKLADRKQIAKSGNPRKPYYSF